MIYLKPIGGLCNRLRAIDSVISICLENKVDLTVLWITDMSLNCSFKQLFQNIKVEGIKVKVIDCPIGFPENFVKNSNLLDHFRGQEALIKNYQVRRIKNIVRGRFLNKDHIHIKKVLSDLDENTILTNTNLSVLYDSQSKLRDKTSRDMDNDFIPIVRPLINELLMGDVAFISSCYRLYPLLNPYGLFMPVENLQKRISSLTESFESTIGLHIRRSDHTTSKTFSTTEKFVEIVEREIEKEPKATFFLSTDDFETKKNLINSFGSSILFNEVTSYNRNNPEAVKDAIVDLFCLSKTKKIYGSHHSSFSQVAADIGQIEEITAR